MRVLRQARLLTVDLGVRIRLFFLGFYHPLPPLNVYRNLEAPVYVK